MCFKKIANIVWFLFGSRFFFAIFLGVTIHTGSILHSDTFLQMHPLDKVKPILGFRHLTKSRVCLRDPVIWHNSAQSVFRGFWLCSNGVWNRQVKSNGQLCGHPGWVQLPLRINIIVPRIETAFQPPVHKPNLRYICSGSKFTWMNHQNTKDFWLVVLECVR